MKNIITKDIKNFKCPKCNRAVYMDCGVNGRCSGYCFYCHFIFTAKPKSFKIKIRDMGREK